MVNAMTCSAPAIKTPESVKAITYWSDFYLKYGASPEGAPNFSTTRDLFPLFQRTRSASSSARRTRSMRS